MLVLRSGKLYDCGTLPCPAEYFTGELWWQKSCYMVADYAYMNLERFSDEHHKDMPYYGEFILTIDAAKDIIERANKALTMEFHANAHTDELSKLFPLGECGKFHYKTYNESFFDDLRTVLRTLPVVMEYAGDIDVILIMYIS